MEIKLSLPIVSPLIALLRDLCATDEAARQSREAATLVGLFTPDFESHGRVRVDALAAPPILRATALLRLRLRACRLSHLSDDQLEKGLDPELHSGDEKTVVLCYLFLATLQVIILEKLPPHAGPVPTLTRAGQAMQRLVRRFLGEIVDETDSEPRVGTECRIVVLNDPINLMQYVSAVFQTVLRMTPEAAEKHMREVHEQKRSVVWVGPRQSAKSYLDALRYWHLSAVEEAIDPAA